MQKINPQIVLASWMKTHEKHTPNHCQKHTHKYFSYQQLAIGMLKEYCLGMTDKFTLIVNCYAFTKKMLGYICSMQVLQW